MNKNRDKETTRQGNSNLAFTSYASTLHCSACGAEIGREFAKFCQVCGKFLPEDYQPLDTLRSSNRMQGKAIVFDKRQIEPTENLFELNENGVSQMAWACFVYSLVPYIGIIFIPLTIAVGGFGVVASYQKPWIGGRKLALVSVSLSFVVLAAQIFLWWLLYIIPTLGREF